MTLAMDLNASRVRAVQGASARDLEDDPLDGPAADLPLVLDLEPRSVGIGRAAAARMRLAPHAVCSAFLPSLGEPREWAGPRHRLDAARALGLVFDHLAGRCSRQGAVILVVPGYLRPEQVALVQRQGELARLRVVGSVDAAVAAVLAAHSRQPWSGPAAVLDVDEYALTWSAVGTADGPAHIVRTEPHPTLGMRAWKERLLDTLADRFVRQSRRDPRDSAEAEQSLYDQLDGVLDSCRDGRTAEMAVQSPRWYQNLLFSAADAVATCASLRDRALRSFHSLAGAPGLDGPVRAVVLTFEAARLPGLTAALEAHMAATTTPQPRDSDDFGLDLIAPEMPGLVHVLGVGEVARAAAELAPLLTTPGHLTEAPLPDLTPPEDGEPRLRFRGQDYPLGPTVFALGRDPRCHLTFDTSEFPSVSGHHCDIVAAPGGAVLFDRSRHGTLVNDVVIEGEATLRPGDWVRLGPEGPLLRFL